MEGKKKEKLVSDRKLWVGLVECVPIAINPSKDEIIGLYNVPEENQTDMEEKTYTSEVEADDGTKHKKVRVNFILKSLKTEDLFSLNFYIIDRDRINKNGDKIQWMNQSGVFTWIGIDDGDEMLPDWFKYFQDVKTWKYTDGTSGKKYQNGAKPNETTNGDKKGLRIAKDGEEPLVEFCRNWLNTWDLRSSNTDFFLDMKKLLNGDMVELKRLIRADEGGTVIAAATIKTKEEDDGIKEYQQIFNKAFLPGTSAKYVSLGNFPKNKEKQFNKFKENFEGEYGCKDFYLLTPIKEYNPEENIAVANETMAKDPASAEY